MKAAPANNSVAVGFRCYHKTKPEKGWLNQQNTVEDVSLAYDEVVGLHRMKHAT